MQSSILISKQRHVKSQDPKNLTACTTNLIRGWNEVISSNSQIAIGVETTTPAILPKKTHYSAVHSTSFALSWTNTHSRQEIMKPRQRKQMERRWTRIRRRTELTSWTSRKISNNWRETERPRSSISAVEKRKGLATACVVVKLGLLCSSFQKNRHTDQNNRVDPYCIGLWIRSVKGNTGKGKRCPTKGPRPN